MRIVSPDKQKSKNELRLIIAAATDLIRQKQGIDFEISDIASAALLPVETVKDHFSNIDQVLAKLFEVYVGEIRIIVKNCMAAATDKATFERAILDTIDYFASQSQIDPIFRELWQNFPGREQAALQENRINAGVIADRICLIWPHNDREEVFRSIWLLAQSVTNIVTIAQDLPELDAAKIIDSYKKIALARGQYFYASEQPTPLP